MIYYDSFQIKALKSVFFPLFSSFFSIQLKQLEKPEKKKNTHVMQQHQYKTTGGSFNVKVVMLISPQIGFQDWAGVYGAQKLKRSPRVQLTLQSNTSADCSARSTKEKNKVRRASPWKHWTWTLFWLRAVGKEADICEITTRTILTHRQDGGGRGGGRVSSRLSLLLQTLLHTKLPTCTVMMGQNVSTLALILDS